MFDITPAQVSSAKSEILSGLTVALALVPEAIAFAFVAHLDALVGLYAAFMVGLITAVFGGRPGMISGATGALAVVMVSLVVDHGAEYLFATVVLMGFIQVTAGALRLGKFIRLVPHPVMMGFVNGLAIVIFLAQLPQLGTGEEPGWLQGTFLEGSRIDIAWLEGSVLYMMLGLIALTMLIIHFLPKLTKAVPSSLVAIVAVSLLVMFTTIDTKVVGDVSSIAGGLPQFSIPKVPFTLETLWIILPYSLILAAIGLIESLLTLRLIDEITQTRGRGNKECIAQGVANTATGFFGGMGGCAMIGQSMINVNSGGRGRLSGISAALGLLAFIILIPGLIEQIPVAALIGVMFIVVLGTFEWSSFRVMRKIPKSDAFTIVLVSAITVFTDLAIAVIAGVIFSALVFAWEHAKQIDIKREDDQMGHTIYSVHGSLFFGSTTNFLQSFDPTNDLDDVAIDFLNAKVTDHSGLEAIDTLAERYKNAGKQLHLLHLSEDCRTLLTKAQGMVEINVIEDPKYFVADDALA